MELHTDTETKRPLTLAPLNRHVTGTRESAFMLPRFIPLYRALQNSDAQGETIPLKVYWKPKVTFFIPFAALIQKPSIQPYFSFHPSKCNSTQTRGSGSNPSSLFWWISISIDLPICASSILPSTARIAHSSHRQLLKTGQASKVYVPEARNAGQLTQWPSCKQVTSTEGGTRDLSINGSRARPSLNKGRVFVHDANKGWINRHRDQRDRPVLRVAATEPFTINVHASATAVGDISRAQLDSPHPLNFNSLLHFRFFLRC